MIQKLLLHSIFATFSWIVVISFPMIGLIVGIRSMGDSPAALLGYYFCFVIFFTFLLFLEFLTKEILPIFKFKLPIKTILLMKIFSNGVAMLASFLIALFLVEAGASYFFRKSAFFYSFHVFNNQVFSFIVFVLLIESLLFFIYHYLSKKLVFK